MLVPDEVQVAEWRAFRKRVADAAPAERAALLRGHATRIRRSIIEMISAAGQGHVGGDLSVTDILTALYGAVLRIDPADPQRRDRDRLVLSKGHCAGALYSALAFAGYFPPSELSTFMGLLSPLNGHPNRTKVPGVETNTGPLGHGLPVAVGEAKGAKILGLPYRVFVVLGDGEMQEGSNWEALMSAAQHRLDNLVVVVDRNRLQQGARTEETAGLDPLDARLAAFGCEVRTVDGHDHLQLVAAFTPGAAGRPVAVIANTIKGKGVSFMEDRVEWHHKVPDPDQVRAALAELGATA